MFRVRDHQITTIKKKHSMQALDEARKAEGTESIQKIRNPTMHQLKTSKYKISNIIKIL